MKRAIDQLFSFGSDGHEDQSTYQLGVSYTSTCSQSLQARYLMPVTPSASVEHMHAVDEEFECLSESKLQKMVGG